MRVAVLQRVACCSPVALVAWIASLVILLQPHPVAALPGTAARGRAAGPGLTPAAAAAPSVEWGTRSELGVEGPWRLREQPVAVAATARRHATLATVGTSGLGVLAALTAEVQQAPALTAPATWQAFKEQAWSTLLSARKGGTHHRLLSRPLESVPTRWKEAVASASATDWAYFGALLSMLLAIDVAVFQHLPETTRTNVLLLAFWLVIGAGVALESWIRLGPAACLRWSVAYLMELTFSVDRLFMSVLILQMLDTPRRLQAKVMFVALLGGWVIRFCYLLGLGQAAAHIQIAPYCIGLWMIYCGFRQVSMYKGPDYQACVTETLPVRTLRALLGNRLDEYYDEEGEQFFVIDKRGWRMTLLGVVLLCLLLSDAILGLDVTLSKEERFQNLFLDFTSSLLGTFAIRALVFVIRDAFATFELAHYSLGPILIFLGVEAIIAHELYVNALMSGAIALCALGTTIAVSVFQAGPAAKVAQ